MAWVAHHKPTFAVAILWIAAALAFWFTGHAIAGWSLVILFFGLPTLAGAGEKERVPNRKWWLAPIAVFLVEAAVVLGLLYYALSKI